MSELNCAVALAQTERAEELINPRKEAGKLFETAVDGFEWFKSQKIGKEFESSYWTFACKLDTEYISWDLFRKEYLKKGGDNYYGAWQLTYNEPLFKSKLFRQRKKLIHLTDKNDLCPNAEKIQPLIKQFKTNYFDKSELENQIDILRSTLEYFD